MSYLASISSSFQVMSAYSSLHVISGSNSMSASYLQTRENMFSEFICLMKVTQNHLYIKLSIEQITDILMN